MSVRPSVCLSVCTCVCVCMSQCPAFDDTDMCACCMDAIDSCLKTDDEGRPIPHSKHTTVSICLSALKWFVYHARRYTSARLYFTFTLRCLLTLIGRAGTGRCRICLDTTVDGVKDLWTRFHSRLNFVFLSRITETSQRRLMTLITVQSPSAGAHQTQQETHQEMR